MLSEIPETNPGDDNTSERLNQIIRRCNREFVGEDFFEDETGALVLSSPSQAVEYRRFEMTEALTLGGSATVEQVFWDDPDYDTEPDGDDPVEFDVYDFHNKFSKPETTSGADGAMGIARKWSDSTRWEIVSMDVPSILKATTKGAVLATDATFTVDNATRVQGYSHVLNSSEEITVNNTFGDAIDDDAVVTIYWNETTGEWDCDNITCPV